jgi:hypothetical protein
MDQFHRGCGRIQQRGRNAQCFPGAVHQQRAQALAAAQYRCAACRRCGKSAALGNAASSTFSMRAWYPRISDSIESAFTAGRPWAISGFFRGERFRHGFAGLLEQYLDFLFCLFQRDLAGPCQLDAALKDR